ncbi:conjugal transfer protein [Bartonella sp. B35(2025)]
MKQLNALQAKAGSKIGAAFAIIIMFLATQSVCAQTIIRNIDILIGMQYGLSMIIPLVAAVIFLFLLVIYIFRLIARATFVRLAFSVIIAGVAFYISHVLFYII